VPNHRKAHSTNECSWYSSREVEVIISLYGCSGAIFKRKTVFVDIMDSLDIERLLDFRIRSSEEVEQDESWDQDLEKEIYDISIDSLGTCERYCTNQLLPF
jgi:hypothetical protein